MRGWSAGCWCRCWCGVAEPPIGYRSIHAVDLTGWEGGEHPGLADLELAIDALRTGAAGAGPRRAGTEPVSRGRWRTALRWVAVAAPGAGCAGRGAVALSAVAGAMAAPIPTGRRYPTRAEPD